MACYILLDEHLSPDIAVTMQNLGHDVLTVQAARLSFASDDELMRFAAAQKRITITGDIRDFTRLAIDWVAAGCTFPGIVLLALRASLLPAAVARRIEEHVSGDPLRLANSLTWLPPLGPEQTIA